MTTVQLTIQHRADTTLPRPDSSAGINGLATLLSGLAAGARPGSISVNVGGGFFTASHDYSPGGTMVSSLITLDVPKSQESIRALLKQKSPSVFAARLITLVMAAGCGSMSSPVSVSLDGGFSTDWGNGGAVSGGSLPSFDYPDVVGTSGFSATGTGAYLAASDGTVGQIQDDFTAGCMFRIDALPTGGDENLFSKGSGTANEWRLRSESGGVLLRAELDGISVVGTDYFIQADDVGKTFIFMATRTATTVETYLYRATDGTAVLVGQSTGGASGVTSTEPLAVGALDGNGGGLEAESFTMIGAAIANAHFTHDEASAYLQACGLAGKMVAFPTANEWRANAVDLWVDEVGSEDLVPTGDQSGSMSDSTFTPAYAGDWDRVFMLLGQSNARGFTDLVNVPTSPTDYTVAFANTPLYPDIPTAGPNWGDLSPLADDNWGSELSFSRELDAAVAYSFRILKVALNGTNLDADWNPSPAGTAWNNFLQDIELSFADPDGATINRRLLDAPLVMGVFWAQGEDDANDAGRAAAYAVNLDAFITNFKLGKYAGASVRFTIDPNFLFVCAKLPIGNTVDAFLPTVNAAFDTVAAARPDTVTMDTDALPMLPDNRHYNGAGLIGLGSGFTSVFLARANGAA